MLRIEVPVSAPGPTLDLHLDWLESQAGVFPRTLFATREGAVIVAGCGAAHIYHSEDSQAQVIPELGQQTHECIRYVGGVRFDASDPHAKSAASEWQAFGRCCWVLPRIELSIGSPRADLAKSSTAESPSGSEAASSCRSLASADNRSGRLAGATLAVQLRWCSAEPTTWAAERRAALDALAHLRPCRTGGKYLGSLARIREGVSREEFEQRVREALAAFKAGSLQKVVLARRVLLELTRKLDAVSLIRHVIGGTHKRQYLFLLEPAEGAAFVSLTPERLCRVHGSDIWTEAVAGTWPIHEFEKIGEAALLASSAKNSSEHQLVVDYVCALLGHVSRHIKVCETHILKLKHLVHMKQSYHATAKEGLPTAPDGKVEGNGVHEGPISLSTFFCEHMSPTPAVCGLPLASARNFIQGAEPWDRGLYAAPCGILSARGSELIVAIRSALLRDGRQLHTYAGAGIVPGSDPSEEFAEISLKMRQFTEAFATASGGREPFPRTVAAFAALPNLNTLWASLVVEECVRLGVVNFVVCPGSRSTPLVVAVARHPHTKSVVSHDERSGAFYALGWAKAVKAPVAVIVTSGTAVANLLPAVVEASQSQVPLLLLTADRPPELRDTGANQTITQPGIFSSNTRWAKDMPCPSTEYPAHALLGDVDLAAAYAAGTLSGHPGPVHLNFCFRENLAPDAGPVRGAPGRTSDWDGRYVDTAEMHRWAEGAAPRSAYVAPSRSLGSSDIVAELVTLAAGGQARIIALVGTLHTVEEALMAEDVALRLGAAIFADITSGLRQRPGTVHYADQLFNCPLLAGELLQLDALVHIGGPLCSARLNAFAKASAARLHVRVAPAPVRLDADHVVTHHLPCGLQALDEALVEAGLQASEGPPPFWKRLSDAAGEVLEALLVPSKAFTEPFVAHAVSSLMSPGNHLQISSSMPIRDLDFFARPCPDASVPPYPPMANRGASGIDGVISTAAGFCRGSGVPTTLLIGDVASLHDLNALQQLSGSETMPLTVVIVNNWGGGIFSFLPIAQHRDVLGTFFSEPHQVDFAAACRAFGVPYILCETATDFEVAYTRSQKLQACGACIIEARVGLSHGENVAMHKKLGQAVAARIRTELLSQVRMGWLQTGCSGVDAAPLVLLHGWLGEKADWAEVTRCVVEAGCGVLAVDLPGHGATEVSVGKTPDPWEAAVLLSLSFCSEALADLLDRLRIKSAILVGYSLGGRVAMSFAVAYPNRVLATAALCANPGLGSVGERWERLQGDCALACRLARESFADFLGRWYAAPLWAGLAKRRPEVYGAMLAKRLRCNKEMAALALVGMSLGRQPDLTPHGSGDAFWYAHGALDEKFAVIGERMRPHLPRVADDCPVQRVTSVPDAGHALVEECPRAVAELCVRIAQHVATTRPPAAPLSEGVPRLAAAWSETVELTLKAPLLLSRGDPMPRRCGLLVVIEARLSQGAEEALFAGVGEVCPLPLFHKESLAEAEAQLGAVLAAWASDPPALPPAIARLDGAMGAWLARNCPCGQGLLPSVRSGLEMALLHVLGRAAGAAHLAAAAAEARGFSCRSDVGVNSLVAREEDLSGPSDGAVVVKVKVGRDPREDARRTNQLAEVLLRQKGPAARLRLDANQAWTVEEAADFLGHLSDDAVAATEYLEEPVKWPNEGPAAFLGAWEALAERTRRRVSFAVDESLAETTLSKEDLAACRAPIAALVLKPALQGIEQTLDFAAWSLEHGARAVVSSAFESGVALSHFAILAAAMAPAAWLPGNGVSACHGLGTFTRLAEDVLCPPFADLVSSYAEGGWRVDTLRCQEALDRTADALVASREPSPKASAG